MKCLVWKETEKKEVLYLNLCLIYIGQTFKTIASTAHIWGPGYILERFNSFFTVFQGIFFKFGFNRNIAYHLFLDEFSGLPQRDNLPYWPEHNQGDKVGSTQGPK